MANKIVIVEAKQDDSGKPIVPNRYTAKPEDIKFSGDKVASITGVKAGDRIPAGKYYVGSFNPETKEFEGQFTPVPAQTVQ